MRTLSNKQRAIFIWRNVFNNFVSEISSLVGWFTTRNPPGCRLIIEVSTYFGDQLTKNILGLCKYLKDMRYAIPVCLNSASNVIFRFPTWAMIYYLKRFINFPHRCSALAFFGYFYFVNEKFKRNYVVV